MIVIVRSKVLPYFLAALSGILLGLSFPPSPLYTLAYVAFFPLFYLYESTERIEKQLLFSYITLFAFHCVTLYWVGGYVVGKDLWMMLAGGALLILHPLFYLPFIALALLAWKKGGRALWYIAFVVFWISFEYLHALTEYAFPWITLGNSQAYDTARIQIAEYTSVYGLSFIILSFNCTFYELTRYLFNGGKVQRKNIFLLSTILLFIFLVPYIFGSFVIKQYMDEPTMHVTIGVVQANIDPWQKWGAEQGTYVTPEQQIEIHLKDSKLLAQSEIDLLIWPETAIPIHIFLPRYSSLLYHIQKTIDSIGVPVFTGVPTYSIYTEENAPVTAERIGESSLYFESYNSTVLFDQRGIPRTIYRKIILVPFAERIPYAEIFRFLIQPLKWNVGISSWGKGSDTVIYELPMKGNRRAKFAGMICYESVFPHFVREFVRRGAEFLVIVTNDSWWGNTSGAYQHAAYASFRAVETRRWIVQAANGGISMVIHPIGSVQQRTELYQQTTMKATLFTRSDETFYVRHGDVFAQGILLCGIGIIFFLIYKATWKKNYGIH